MMKSTPKRQLWGIVLAAGEGTRVREFLTQACGGRGIKQFSAVTGRRSLLQHTLDRVERLIPRERILVVVSTEHRPEVEAQLKEWPVKPSVTMHGLTLTSSLAQFSVCFRGILPLASVAMSSKNYPLPSVPCGHRNHRHSPLIAGRHNARRQIHHFALLSLLFWYFL